MRRRPRQKVRWWRRTEPVRRAGLVYFVSSEERCSAGNPRVRGFGSGRPTLSGLAEVPSRFDTTPVWSRIHRPIRAVNAPRAAVPFWVESANIVLGTCRFDIRIAAALTRMCQDPSRSGIALAANVPRVREQSARRPEFSAASRTRPRRTCAVGSSSPHRPHVDTRLLRMGGEQRFHLGVR
jgi:hypothetical protein